jgi:hypothetical protein
MSKVASKRINIFLSIDRKTINNYFNPHDNSSLYKRQLRFDFVEYLDELLNSYKRHSFISYKICYKDEDAEMVKPFMHAVRRHFYIMEQQKRTEFKKFKKRNFRLLLLSIVVVMFCQGVLPMLLLPEFPFHSTLLNSIDIFSWVVLWRPIDRLIFNWNPFLKDISLLHKMANADIIRIKSSDKLFQKTDQRLSFPKTQVRA